MSDDIVGDDDEKFTVGPGDLKLVRAVHRRIPLGYDWKLGDDGATIYLYRDGKFAGTLAPDGQ